MEYDSYFKKIESKSKKIIEEFIYKKIKDNPVDGNYHYSINYLYNFLTNSHSNFYGIFNINNDKVIAFVKKIRLYTTQYNRMFDLPISISGNRLNELELMNNLFKDKYIKQAIIPSHRFNFIPNTYEIEKEIVDQNFYSSNDDIYSNKFLTKHRIKSLLIDSNFTFSLLTSSDIVEITDIYRIWCKNKEDSNSSVHSKELFSGYFKNFNAMTYQSKQYGLRYKEKLIAFAVFVPMLEGYYYKIIQMSYNPNNVNDYVLKNYISQIGQIFHYLCFVKLKEEGMKYISCAGAAEKKSGLLNHKLQIYQHHIDYYIIKQKENTIE
jgi:hypothetical protein